MKTRLIAWIAGVAVALAVLALAGAISMYLAFRQPPPPLQGALREAAIEAAGMQWQFHYYLSDKLPAKAPIVFVLHGSGMTGQQVRAAYNYRFDELADRHGLLPVYPTGFERHWNDCRDGADYRANVEDVDDIAFVRAMIDYLAAQYGADRDAVLVTGLSNGGHMAYKIALEAPGLAAAIAPIAASLPARDATNCRPRGGGLPTLIMNGTEDPVNPYGGGLVSLLGNDSRGVVRSSLQTAQFFADLAGHEKGPAETRAVPDHDDDASSVEVTTWRAPGLDEVRHYGILGGGHTVPTRGAGSMPAFLVGPTNADIEAADEIWAFFSEVLAKQQPSMPPQGSRRDSPAVIASGQMPN